jgi:hypothetical protein
MTFLLIINNMFLYSNYKLCLYRKTLRIAIIGSRWDASFEGTSQRAYPPGTRANLGATWPSSLNILRRPPFMLK